MRRELQNIIVGIVGRKGSGKSTVLAELIRHKRRVVILDVCAEHRSPNIFTELDEFAEYLRRHEQGPLHCAYRPIEESPEEALEFVCDEIYNAGNLCFCLEEAARFTSPGSMPQALDLVIRLGRHRGIDTIWTAQRVSEISRTLSAMTDVWVLVGACTEPRDLDCLEDRCGKAVCLKVQKLGLHGRLIYKALNAQMIEVGRGARI